jgi:hypothetical protein
MTLISCYLSVNAWMDSRINVSCEIALYETALNEPFGCQKKLQEFITSLETYPSLLRRNCTNMV